MSQDIQLLVDNDMYRIISNVIKMFFIQKYGSNKLFVDNIVKYLYNRPEGLL